MMLKVVQRGKYFYNYSEYLLTILLRAVCCCCASKGCHRRLVLKLERHEAASEMLANEIDIVKLLYVQRIGQFMAKLMLKRHQRALITNFDKLNLNSLEKEKYRTVTDSETLL